MKGQGDCAGHAPVGAKSGENWRRVFERRCCFDVTKWMNRRSTLVPNEGDMFDIYLNGRRDLLVVPRGFAIPAGLDGSWRRKKRAVRSVSDVIRQDVQQRGYHRRSLISNRSKTAVETPSNA